MKKIAICLLTASLVFAGHSYSYAQTKEMPKLTELVRVPVTSVKSQGGTGTCWCFATTSFMEAELIRMGKGELDLSEMFTVRNNYYERLDDNFLRRGKGNISEGSIAHMTMNVVKKYGMITQEAYSGIPKGGLPNHGELTRYLRALVDASIKAKKRTPEYYQLQEALFDTYMGKVPATFEYKGKEYTPESFRDFLGFNPEDYVEITSLAHHPFYEQVALEIPDNWDHQRLYNLPLDEFIGVIDYALNKGFSLCWDGDCSESGYVYGGHGLSKIPAKGVSGKDLQNDINAKEIDEVSQELRQEWFESFKTTDDHLEHIMGIAKDANGVKYYIIKNSWGPKNSYGGFHYFSEKYMRAKTLGILVHKDGLSKDIKKKLGIK